MEKEDKVIKNNILTVCRNRTNSVSLSKNASFGQNSLNVPLPQLLDLTDGKVVLIKTV